MTVLVRGERIAAVGKELKIPARTPGLLMGAASS
jgi:hypothetical protein